MSNEMTLAEFLAYSKSFIDTKDKWIQKQFSANIHGEATAVHFNETCKYCSVGATFAAIKGNEHLKPLRNKAMILLKEIMGTSVILYNDRHTHEQVMEKFDLAISVAKERNL